MIDLTRLLIASAVAGALALTGCDAPSDPGTGSGAASHDGHDHDGDGHDDHDHDGDGHGDHTDGDHDDHDHGAARVLGTIEVGGSTLEVSLAGDVTPGAEIHVDVVKTAGPTPAAVRVWVGDEAATGVMKAKADGHGDHFHGHAETPAALGSGLLWIEVERLDGSRVAKSVPLGG